MTQRHPATSCVLAIDDSPEVLALLAVRLRPDGVRLLTATSFVDGLASAMSAQPDLILLDVDMPELSGLDLCRRLKSEPTTSHIPVIFLTGSSDITTKVHGFDLGAVDYVTKPFHPAELRARVRAALRMKRAQDMLAQKAQTDALTGLHNRAFFDECLALEIAQSLRTRKPLSLVLIDLDYFKKLNDGYGHPFGDLVLERVGDLLTRSKRPTDAVCRYGGEELAMVLTDTTLESACAVAERIRNQIRDLGFSPRGEPVTVTASFGVAEALEFSARTGDVRPVGLIGDADEALYAAKREGRDCVRSHRASPVRADVSPRRDSSVRVIPSHSEPPRQVG